MKRAGILLANVIWIASCFSGWLLFRLASLFPGKIQENVLRKILGLNQETEFGRNHNFDRIKSISDFRRLVPVGDYGSHKNYITEIMGGKENVLVGEDIQVLMPTSGSTGGVKYIPYTASLQRQFRAGISPWLFSLYLRNPRLFLGTAYWSITPAGSKQEETPSGIQVGYQSDGEYLGKTAQLVLNAVMNAPSEIGQISEMDNVFYATLLFLLRDKDLALISVWSPTFLTVLLDRFTEWGGSIVADIESGTVNLPIKGDQAVAEKLKAKTFPDPKRASEIRTRTSVSGRKMEWTLLWPKLRVISCWADGSSENYLPGLQSRFPTVSIQPKGLLSTEGIVSFPLCDEPGAVPSIRSHFYEFLEVGTSAVPKLLIELEVDGIYEVVLTTSGGLYRYRTSDLVEVVDIRRGIPRLRFVGRIGNVSDLFGEKLHEEQIIEAMSAITVRQRSRLSFWMVAPDKECSGETHYTLFIKPADPDGTDGCREIADELERSLLVNPHYKYARELGQLSSLRAVLVEEDYLRRYTEGCVQLGQRLGDVKLTFLRKEFGWTERFQEPITTESAVSSPRRCT